MNADVGVVYGLWNQDIGGAELLDRVVGEVGVEHVTVPVVCGPVAQILATHDGPRFFHAEAGWHFGPLGDTVAGHSLKPHAAGWLRRRNVLPPFVDALQQRGIGVVFRVDVAGFAALREGASVRTRSVLIESEPDSGVCPSNPFVRDLLEATIADLESQGPAAIELVDWTPSLAVDRFRPRKLGWDPLLRAMLDICFCPACRQAAQQANGDAEGAAHAVREALRRGLGPTPDGAAANVATVFPSEVSAYVSAVRAQNDDWLAGMAKRSPKLRFLAVRNVARVDELAAAPAGWDKMLRRAPETAGGATSAESGQVSLSAGAASLWVQPPWVGSSSDLVTLTRSMFEQGARFLDFEGIEEAPAGVDWLRQALRYARRD